ncbi:hypothetical protein [uncultured Methanoregula sp.]|uniref:hypothetical protein n=1 Tax=uncultured Methanoregula sp. TaxID=1005933 RepID=UPI002AAAABA9|nr:hypothetical protein [uncultured Methanoregula sp.]
MNRTYFGDTRDLFKFDLVRHIMKAGPAFESFTFIPMLTATDESSQGKKSPKKDLTKARKTGKAGSQNQDLVAQMEHLQEIENDTAYFQHIRGYFNKEHIFAHIFCEEKFSHQDRARYFERIFSHIPKKSLILLDPDIGLEENRPTEKHLLFDEVKKITDSMDTRSVLMIYQHFPRVKHDGYVQQRCSQLSRHTGIDPLTITDNEILFFILAKNEKLRTEMEEVLERYANSYPLLTS